MSEREKQQIVNELRAEWEAIHTVSANLEANQRERVADFEDRIYEEVEQRAQEIASQWIEAIEDRAEQVLQAKAAETALLMHPEAMRV